MSTGKYIVYMAKNKVNGKRYIGLTSLSLVDRQRQHMSEVRRGIYDHPFHDALRHEHEDTFEWRILSEHGDIGSAVSFERKFIESTHPEYNSGRPGAGRFGPRSMDKQVVCLNDGAIHESASAAARHYDIAKSAVIEVCLRRPFRNTAGGRIFRYEDDCEGGLEKALQEIAEKKKRTIANIRNSSRAVICEDDGKIFASMKMAERYYGINPGALSGGCSSKRYAKVGGLSFRHWPHKLPNNISAYGKLPDVATSIENVTWREIPGLEGRYAVSDNGHVCGLDRVVPHSDQVTVRRKGHIILSCYDKDGYEIVTLNRKCRRVHQLVALAFIGIPPTPGMMVCHKNGIKTDNWYENLYYGTAQDNAADRLRHAAEKEINGRL